MWKRVMMIEINTLAYFLRLIEQPTKIKAKEDEKLCLTV